MNPTLLASVAALLLATGVAHAGDGGRRSPENIKGRCARSRRKRKDSIYGAGRSPDWLKMKNPDAPAVKREAEEDWGR
jgi:hypothetical protein